MADKPLSLAEYMSYIEATTSLRCLIDGEEVLNAGPIVLHGRTDCSPTSIKICAVCLQSSALQTHPHQIIGELKISNGAAKIFKMHCRKNLSELKDISKTQLNCIWTDSKKSVKQKYKATCVREMPCIKPKLGMNVPVNMNDDLRKTVLESFMKKLPNSAIAKHSKGRHSDNSAKSGANVVALDKNIAMTSEFVKILDNAAQSVIMMQIHFMPSLFSFACCEGVFCNILNESASSKASIEETLPSCGYLKKENGVYQLKKKHKYVSKVLYASFDMSLIIIEIDFDFEFALEMLTKVERNYFS
ncbi:unnamed protein product [Ceutorhynchus assimilis]|uniref:Uncharacterized protein n=1 Tax=Ceutorhynchus assimilis TaxID=467358 RepID=A0A9N9QS86_9CUCU|nr:unnamed protein product [Ceutorhynchus assimilis]